MSSRIRRSANARQAIRDYKRQIAEGGGGLGGGETGTSGGKSKYAGGFVTVNGRKNNSPAYNHNYYMANKDKWRIANFERKSRFNTYGRGQIIKERGRDVSPSTYKNYNVYSDTSLTPYERGMLLRDHNVASAARAIRDEQNGYVKDGMWVYRSGPVKSRSLSEHDELQRQNADKYNEAQYIAKRDTLKKIQKEKGRDDARKGSKVEGMNNDLDAAYDSRKQALAAAKKKRQQNEKAQRINESQSETVINPHKTNYVEKARIAAINTGRAAKKTAKLMADYAGAKLSELGDLIETTVNRRRSRKKRAAAERVRATASPRKKKKSSTR